MKDSPMKSTFKILGGTFGFAAAVVLGLHFTTATPVQAGVLDSIMNADKEEVTPTDAYEVDVYGWDARIYEWTPKHNNNVSCVFVASNKSSGVACYEKAQ